MIRLLIIAGVLAASVAQAALVYQPHLEGFGFGHKEYKSAMPLFFLVAPSLIPALQVFEVFSSGEEACRFYSMSCVAAYTFVPGQSEQDVACRDDSRKEALYLAFCL